MTMISERSTVDTATIDDVARWSAPPNPSVLPTIVIGDGSVVAFRKRPVVGLGYLADRLLVESQRLVSAQDLLGRSWWIPAVAVWSDGDSDHQPQHPWHVGLAAGRSRDMALLAGLSDRLGWEANATRELGCDLPVLADLDGSCPTGVTVFDGRLDHGVPTVVVVSGTVVRWGAGATFASAYHRALYGDHDSVGHGRELDDMARMLADEHLDVVAVDLGTPLIRKAGVARYSVQLSASSHEPGRSWDANPVN